VRTDLLAFLGVLVVALASMPVYAVTGAGRRDALDVADRGTFVLGGFVRSWFYWFVGPVERLAVALRLSPTAFNLLGVAFGVAAGVAFAAGGLVTGGWLVLLGGIADVLDGRIARALGVAGARGAFLDSTLDRFAEVGAFVGLAVFYQASAVALAIVASGLGGSLLVSYARARGESVGVVCKVGVMQRAERLLTVGLGGILDPAVTAGVGWAEGTLLIALLTLIAVGTVGTAAYRTVWIARRLD
jgi:CDP-diacylglycerol---glycerol-3-phosphate 3-phosphatidyltransferase